MNCVTVCFETGRTVQVPFQQQFPQVRIGFAEKTELVYTLIVTKPTPPPLLPRCKSGTEDCFPHTTYGSTLRPIRFPPGALGTLACCDAQCAQARQQQFQGTAQYLSSLLVQGSFLKRHRLRSLVHQFPLMMGKPRIRPVFEFLAPRADCVREATWSVLF